MTVRLLASSTVLILAALAVTGTLASSQTLSAYDGELQFAAPGISYTVRPLIGSDTTVTPIVTGAESGTPMTFVIASLPGAEFDVSFSILDAPPQQCWGSLSPSFASDGLAWEERAVRLDPTVPQRIICDTAGVATLDVGLRLTIPSTSIYREFIVSVAANVVNRVTGDTLRPSASFYVNHGDVLIPTDDGRMSDLSRGYTYTLTADSGANKLVPVVNGHEWGIPTRLWQDAFPGERVEFHWTLPAFLFNESDGRIPCSFGPDAVFMKETGEHFDPHTPAIVRIPPNCFVTMEMGITVAVPADAEPGVYSGQVLVDARYIGNFRTAYHPRVPLGGMEMIFAVSVGERDIPKAYALLQNYPNPFNGSTKITYGLPDGEEVTLSIIDLLGREVRTIVHGFQYAGWHTADWSANENASGLYFYHLRTPHFSQIGKLLLVR